jgi:hypothetical protein
MEDKAKEKVELAEGKFLGSVRLAHGIKPEGKPT